MVNFKIYFKSSNLIKFDLPFNKNKLTTHCKYCHQLSTGQMQKINQMYFLQQHCEDHLLDFQQDLQGFCNRQKNKKQIDSSILQSIKKSNSKVNRSLIKNKNEQLQDLLETQTVHQGNLSHLSTQKKRLFTDISFFSKDHTHDHSIQQGYNEFMNKIHFQRSRNRQLNQSLEYQKQKMIKKYLNDIMEQFKQLSQQNKQLRQIYKKQSGGGYKANQKKNQSSKIQQLSKYQQNQFQLENNTPRNVKTGRRSIAAVSVSGSQHGKNSTKLPSKIQKLFFGNENLTQQKHIQMVRQNNKMLYCQSSINIHGQSLVPSPKKHKRRQSQLTQRKDYPRKQSYQNDYLFVFDSNSQISFDNQCNGRMSQPGKMPKQKKPQQIEQKYMNKDSKNIQFQTKNGRLAESVQRNSDRGQYTNEYQSQINPTNSKNIFIEFLQSLLLEQKITFDQMTDDIQVEIEQQNENFHVPNYNKIKFIQQLESQITTKNLKIRQLQQVINVFKGEIQQIMGTDIKIINQVMLQLLQVKGKYLDMQEKVDGLSGLKEQLQAKQKMKSQILANIKQTISKKKQNSQTQKSKQKQGQFEIFAIPQSIKTLFQCLNTKIKDNANPIDYLNQIKQLPTNKQLFQVFDSNKRKDMNIKIKQVIDAIRQSRQKFNELIKIYEGRVSKLQQKIQKYKGINQGQSLVN